MERLTILKEFNEFIDEDRELVQLTSIEDRSDDLGTSALNKFDGSLLSLFILSQKSAKGGFVERNLLSKKDAKRIEILRQMLEEDSTLKDQIIKTIEDSLSISYSEKLVYRDLSYFQLHNDEIKLEEKIPGLRKNMR